MSLNRSDQPTSLRRRPPRGAPAGWPVGLPAVRAADEIVAGLGDVLRQLAKVRHLLDVADRRVVQAVAAIHWITGRSNDRARQRDLPDRAPRWTRGVAVGQPSTPRRGADACGRTRRRLLIPELPRWGCRARGIFAQRSPHVRHRGREEDRRGWWRQHSATSRATATRNVVLSPCFEDTHGRWLVASATGQHRFCASSRRREGEATAVGEVLARGRSLAAGLVEYVGDPSWPVRLGNVEGRFPHGDLAVAH